MPNYTRDSSPLGYGAGTLSPAQINWAFAVSGEQPPGLGEVIQHWCSHWDVNADLAAGQCHLETGGWTSRIAREKNNPGGLGALNHDPFGTALSFPSVAEGVAAFVAHIVCYARRDPPPDAVARDPRYPELLRRGWLGVVETLTDFEQRWAWSPPAEYAASPVEQRYGAKLAARANRLVQLGADMSPEPTSAELGFPVQYVPADPSVKGYYGAQYGAMSADAVAERRALAIDWLVVHCTEGHWPTDRDYLQRGHDVSARAVIAPDGTVACMVPLDEIAWTGGHALYNARGVHYELSGFARDGFGDAQYQALAALIVHDQRRMPNPPPPRYVGRSGERGLIAHADIPNPRPASHPAYCGPWGGGSCHHDPGPAFDWPKLERLIQERLRDTSPRPATLEFFPQTGRSMQLGFLAFYQWLRQSQHQIAPSELLLAGYPKTDELADVPLMLDEPPAAAMQLLERATLIYEPDNSAPWDIHFALHWQTVAAIIYALERGYATPESLNLRLIVAPDGSKGLALGSA